MFCRQIILMKVLFLFLTLSQIIDALFVGVGEYPDYRQYGINLEDCGRSVKPEYYMINRVDHCFVNSPGNFTVRVLYDTVVPPDVSSRVYNGRFSVIGESPWTVFLMIGFGTYSQGVIHDVPFGTPVVKTQRGCTGVLITFEWVLTAALCVGNDIPEHEVVQVEVWAGDLIVYNKADVHKNFKPIYEDPHGPGPAPDRTPALALIKLIKPYVPVFQNIRTYSLNTVCLPNINALNNKEEDWATFTGWGATDNTHQRPHKFRLAQIRLNPQRDCIPGMNQLCSIASQTQHMEAEPCGNDWGGPLVQFSNEKVSKAILVGTLRTYDQGGTDSCPSNGSSYFIPTAHYVEWILSIVKTK